MARLTLEAKQVIIKKALDRKGKTLNQIANENNIGYSTLCLWLKKSRQGIALNSDRCIPTKNRQEEKAPLQHLLSTAGLDEEAIGAYCRNQGIHSFQLKQWTEELMKKTSNETTLKTRKEIKALREEIKKLKRDLHRKDKALAETSALLILKKKANLIWGEPEDV